jgi:hypothetical protein
MMDARMRLEALTTRIGAVAFPLGVILLMIATAIHPSREHPMDNPAVFLEYAQSESWIAVHLAQWIAALLIIAGLLAVYYTLRTKAEVGAEVAHFGFVAVVLTADAFTMLQAVDGVALKWAVDTWASAPVEQKADAFAAAEAVRWTEYALQSFSNILLGLTLILYGVAIALGTVYPPLARGDSCGLWSCLDRPRSDGALYWLIRLDPQGGRSASHVCVGVHHGVSDVAQQ